MGMPLTRDLTLGPGSIFPSTLGNTLQDCIIGAKHGLIEISISASAFIVETGAPTRSQNIWTFQTSTANIIVADLRLPVGTKITQLVWSFNRNSTDGASLWFQLNKYPRGGGALFAQGLTAIGTGTGWTTLIDNSGSDPGLPHDVQAAAAYQLSVETKPPFPFSGAPKFDGVTITIERL